MHKNINFLIRLGIVTVLILTFVIINGYTSAKKKYTQYTEPTPAAPTETTAPQETEEPTEPATEAATPPAPTETSPMEEETTPPTLPDTEPPAAPRETEPPTETTPPETEPPSSTEPVVEPETEPTEPATEPTEEPTTEPTEPEEEWRSLGTYTLTAYCSCYKCCGQYALNRPLDENGKPIVYTSIGAVAKAGVTIAVDPSIIPYGSEVKINDHVYIAQDTGGGIRGGRIDVYFDDHQDALNFGRQSAEVFIRA